MLCKSEEKVILEKIRSLIIMAGPDSYIENAFRGCLELAEYNIINDAMCSLKGQNEMLENMIKEKASEIDSLQKKLQETYRQMKELSNRLEREQEWGPYIDKTAYSDNDYIKLRESQDSCLLTDEEAQQLIAEEFGFIKEKIQIKRTMPVYEINRHRQLRKVGIKDRAPIYCCSDWNYIYFSCCGYDYEMQNSNLQRI